MYKYINKYVYLLILYANYYQNILGEHAMRMVFVCMIFNMKITPCIFIYIHTYICIMIIMRITTMDS